MTAEIFSSRCYASTKIEVTVINSSVSIFRSRCRRLSIWAIRLNVCRVWQETVLAFASIILLVVAVLFLFDRLRAERKSLAEAISWRNCSERQCISAAKWFITVLSAANNQDQVKELLRKSMRWRVSNGLGIMQARKNLKSVSTMIDPFRFQCRNLYLIRMSKKLQINSHFGFFLLLMMFSLLRKVVIVCWNFDFNSAWCVHRESR